MTKDKAQSLSGGNLRSELCKNDSLSQLSLISPTYLEEAKEKDIVL
ncbi:hypothetical protein HCG51_26070 [Tolypothrix sp. PCC 7910]|nr:hypothetical protein [Tolypothrix sp. PCC 7910]QIR39832.1 hypothetical protein HCG51_26070 [Tolypothrix sp. PCC 7910]